MGLAAAAAAGAGALRVPPPVLVAEAPPGATRLDAELDRYHPLEVGRAPWLDPDGGWNACVLRAEGATVSLRALRVAEGWEEVDGVPHLRISLLVDNPRRRVVLATEWVRADGPSRLLCSRRQVAGDAYDLVPPQPVLQGPLAAGAAWSWEGTVGGRPARAAWRVVGRRLWRSVEDVLEVAQTTTLLATGEVGELEATQVRRYAPGVGLVGEEGRLPLDDPEPATEGIEAWAAPVQAPAE